MLQQAWFRKVVVQRHPVSGIRSDEQHSLDKRCWGVPDPDESVLGKPVSNIAVVDSLEPDISAQDNLVFENPASAADCWYNQTLYQFRVAAENVSLLNPVQRVSFWVVLMEVRLCWFRS